MPRPADVCFRGQTHSETSTRVCHFFDLKRSSGNPITLSDVMALPISVRVTGGDTVLQQMNQRLQVAATFEAAISTILADVVALHGAEFGNVQLVAGDKLLIVAEHGLRAPFLLAFREVRTTDGCACGRAWKTGEPIVLEDVGLDKSFAPFREIAKEAGFRSVQSTPLIASNSRPLGMVSTHFANRYVPTKIEMATCKAYCAMAADHLQALLDGSPLELEAQKLHDALYANLGVHASALDLTLRSRQSRADEVIK